MSTIIVASIPFLVVAVALVARWVTDKMHQEDESCE